MISRRFQSLMPASSPLRSTTLGDRSRLIHQPSSSIERPKSSPATNFFPGILVSETMVESCAIPAVRRSMKRMVDLDLPVIAPRATRTKGGRAMATAWQRRAFLGASAAGVLGAGVTAQRGSFAALVTRETFTYKTVGKLSIKADVYNGGA